MAPKKAGGIPQWLATTIIAVISIVWAINFFAQLFIETYKAPAGIDALMLAVVGVVAGTIARLRRDQKEEGTQDE